MAKKKMETKGDTPLVNPEYAKVEKDIRREKMIIDAQPKIRKIAVLLWMVADIVLVTLFIGYIGFYFVSGSFSDRQQVATIGDNVSSMHNITEARSASPLLIENVVVITTGSEQYDFYVEVENPNIDWYATFSYHFTSRNGDSKAFEGSIMPGETRPIVALHQDFEVRPSDAELVLENLSWKRVEAGEILDINMWLTEHNGFVVEDADYNFDVKIEGDAIPRTSFTITNSTSYSYWQPEFIVLITRAGSISGVNSVTISGLESGETRKIELNWFGTAPSSGTVTVIPNINFFDETVYMDPSGDSGIDIRDDVGDRRL